MTLMIVNKETREFRITLFVNSYAITDSTIIIRHKDNSIIQLSKVRFRIHEVEKNEEGRWIKV